MELERRLRKVARYHLGLFLLPLLSLLYYGWWTAAQLDQQPGNPLRLSPISLRGDILDRHSRPLARSIDGERAYPLKTAAGSLLGYHLRGRNQSGLEALLQTSLSPPPPPKSLWGALSMDQARREGQAPLRGPNITLTLDAELQRLLYETLLPHAGVVVVAELNNGEILAAVSAPSFDPHEVARDWQSLRSDPRSPLIERVGGGLYPVRALGGAPLLTQEQSQNHPWFGDNPFPAYPGASSAVAIEGDFLFSPLMLLQIAAQHPERPLPMQPNLLPGQHSTGVTESESEAWAPSMIPYSGRGEKVGDWELFALLGPKFRESPPFQVLLGRRSKAEGLAKRSRALAFAVVLEGANAAEAARFRGDLLEVLQTW